MTLPRILPSLLLLFTLTLAGETAMATEEPVHTVSLKDGAFEIRDYPALIAAEVTVGGERSDAVSAGFRLLAGYIFGGNVRKQSIAMTTPVVQAKPGGESMPMTAPVTQVAAGNDWVIRFMMPAGYTLDTLPTPNDPKVRLVTLPSTRVAVVRFSGLAGEDSITEKTAELSAFIASHQLRSTGTSSLARYDPPWTPWFMRRNEVMIPLAAAAAP